MSSKVVDQRVVQMEFDNRRFERNVSTTMSSLDKLKQKLNFTGAVKGFDNIDSASKKVNMNGLSNAVDTVNSRFSALEIIGVTALANLTNSAVNAGKRILSALTIQPVTTGFQEYETQINAIQTILANTQSKGSTLEDVNAALDKLNTYADKTIYNFTEMTRNIGTFTAAGVDLDKSVNAIQGIANLAAVSGSTSQQASTAMYQLSQALASGTVKLMDWNSVVNAGMGGEVFQNALKETAKVHGVAVDEMIEKNGSFRETLQEEWLTAEILTETLEKFTMNTKYATQEEIKANREKLKSIGYTEDQIDAIFELGNTATGAATEVKTFSQLFDTLKESAQSGWTKTWQIIVGDFGEAKSFMSMLSEGLGGIIEKMSSWRNGILETALGSKWSQLTAKINEAGISTDDFNDRFKKIAKEHGISIDDLIKEHGSLEAAMADSSLSTDLVKETLSAFADEAKAAGDSTEDMSGKLEYFQEVVRKVWRGDYGNMEDRYKALTAAGYDYAQVQSLVNKTVDGHELTLADLTDTQLKAVGYTEEQVKAIRALAEEAEKTGTPLNELIASLDKPSGRTLLIESLKNAAVGLTKSFTAVKDAFLEIFPAMKAENISTTLYKLVESLNNFSKSLRMSDETAEKLKRTFKGVFALVDIILTLVGGPLKMLFNAVLDILGLANVDILSVTANIGDAIVALRDWIDEHNIFTIALKKILPFLKDAAEGVKNWIEGLKNTDNIGKYIVDGLVNGLRHGIKTVGSTMLDMAKKIVDTVKNFLGIHSPSTVFFAIGTFIIAGLILGLKDGLPGIGESIKGIGQKIVDMFKGLSLEKVLAVAVGAGLFTLMFKIVSAITNFAGAVFNITENLGDMFEGLGVMFKSAGKMFKGIRNWFNSMAIVNIVLAIAVLAKAVISIAESEATIGQLWNAVGIIAVLTVFAAGIAILMGKLDLVGGMGFKTILSVAAIAGAILLLSLALSKIATMNLENVQPALTLLTGILGLISGVVAIMAWIARGKGEKEAFKVGRTLIALSVAMLIMLGVVKLASNLAKEGDAVIDGIGVLGLIALLFGGILIVSRLAGNNINDAGKALRKVSVALLIMVAVIKLASMLKEDEITRGMQLIGYVALLFAGIVLISRLAGKNGANAGGMILMMSVAMLAIVAVIKIVAGITDEEVDRGLKVIANISLLFAAIMLVSYFAGANAMKAGVMLLAMSGAMLIMVGVLFLLSQFPDETALSRALAVVATLGVLFIGLVAVTALIPANALGVLITLTVAVGLLAGIVVGLSFLDPSGLLNAVGAITVLILAFTLMIGISKLAGSTKTVMGTIIALGAVITALGLVLIAMGNLDPQTTITNAIALAGLMIVLTGLVVAIHFVGKLLKNGSDALTGMLFLVAMIVALLPAVGILALMSGVDNAITNTLALIILVSAMSILLVGLNYIGKLLNGGDVASGMLLLVAMTVALLPAVGILALMSGVDNATENTKALIMLVTALTLLLLPLALVGHFGLAAIAGVAILLAFMVALGAFVAAVGYFVTNECPKLEQFIDAGLPIIEKLAYGMGSLISNFAAGLLSGLPAIGESLSEFMVSIEGFIEGAKNITPEAMIGISSLVGAVLLLTAANMIDGIGKFLGLTNGNSLGSFGEQLSQFGTGLGTFFKSLTDAGLNEEKLKLVDIAAGAIKALAEASNSIPNSGGLLGAIVGDNDLGTFADQFPKLGEGLRDFLSAVGTFGEDQLAIIENGAKAVVKISEAANSIPNSGGWFGAIVGDNDLGTFADQFPKLADGLRGFLNKIGTFEDAQVAIIEAAANAVVTLANASDKIPNQGGWAAAIIGDNNLELFANQFPKLADGLRGFLNNIGTFEKGQIETVRCAADAVVTLSSAASRIPNQGGWVAAIIGDNDLGTFASQFPLLGAGIRGFVDKIGELTSGELVSSARALEVVELMTDLANVDVGGLHTKIESLGKTMTTFGDNIVTFSNTMDSGNITISLKNAVNGVKDLVDALAIIPADKANHLRTISECLRELGRNGVRSFVEAYSGTQALSTVKTAASTMVNAFVTGVKTKASDIASTFESAVSSAYARITTMAIYNKFVGAGANLAQGFANGIRNNTYKVVTAAEVMASAAVQAAKRRLDEHSPSRVFYGIGDFAVQGFANALTAGATDAYGAGSKMADAATNGLSDAISRISAILESGIDTQPVIRPVLDLDNVRTGASQIGGMLSMSPSVGVLANVNGIASTMNARGQNGVNDGVISELGKLRKDISSLKHITYNIDGVTYGEGSDVAEAIETLVRAAIIERRV